MPTQRVSKRASISSRILEQSWTAMRHIITGLPPAVLLVMDADGRRRKFGHFAPSTWRVRGEEQAHEVSLSPRLFAQPTDLLATMVHEAVHALLYATTTSSVHVAGVSVRDRYYHRREFRDECRRLGLECQYLNGRYGWTLTKWPESGVPEQYQPVLRLLERMPPGSVTRVAQRVEGRSSPESGNVRLQCRCQPERTIHVARRQAALGGFVCDFCRSEFHSPADPRLAASETPHQSGWSQPLHQVTKWPALSLRARSEPD